MRIEMNGHYSIAIDGPSGAGKSSLARRAAAALGFIYVDTGAVYRTVGLACHRAGINCKDAAAVEAVLPGLNILMSYNEAGEQRMYLDEEDVSSRIRMPEISICASDVSSIPAVRLYLLDMQRRMARENNVIMDGRDIGTVVLPHADLKIFMTASSAARAQRRLLELQSKGIKVSFEEVFRDIEYRDKQDSTRVTAPMKPAEDAVILDTTNLNLEESYRLLCRTIREKLGIRPSQDR